MKNKLFAKNDYLFKVDNCMMQDEGKLTLLFV